MTFSEPVFVSQSSFTLTCTTSGAHPVSVEDGTTTYTLNPTTDFTANETCTLTVIAENVSDVDSIDPPDTMAANHTTTFGVAGAGPCESTPTHEIGAVQGDGAATPVPAGVRVTVRGVVVGDVPGLLGFYLQDADGDNNAATSDGIFVFSAVPVGLGDTVAVTGTVSERFGQTQINSPIRCRGLRCAPANPIEASRHRRRSTCRRPTASASRSRGCAWLPSTRSRSARSSS